MNLRIHTSTVYHTLFPVALAEILLQFVEPPARIKLSASFEFPDIDLVRQRTIWDYNTETRSTDSKEIDVYVKEYSAEEIAIQDVMVVLRLVEQGKVSLKNGSLLPTNKTISALKELLTEGDFFEIETDDAEHTQRYCPGYIKSFSWPIMVYAAGLAEFNSKGPLRLTSAGVEAMTQPPHEILKQIWDFWVENVDYEEFNRIDYIKGQKGKGSRGFTLARDRRKVIAEALKSCPCVKWVEFDEFSRFMRSENYKFQVHRDLWDLYIYEKRHGSLGYSGFGGWNVVEERYLMCLLFEYAAPLGIIDLIYEHPHQARDDYNDIWGADDLPFLSRYDGIYYFRVTPLGYYILGLADSWETSKLDTGLSISTLSDNHIYLEKGVLLPADQLLLERYTDLVEDDHWIINEKKILKALRKEKNLNRLIDFFAEERIPSATFKCAQSPQ